VNKGDKRVYYEITPLGVSSLLLFGRIKFREALEHLSTRPKKYYELLARLQPNLRNYLTRISPIFLDQLTEDLWIIYSVKNRKALRKYTIAGILGRSDSLKDEERSLHYELQLMCVNRAEIEGKTICLKERKACHFVPSEIAKCDILRRQMETEWTSIT